MDRLIHPMTVMNQLWRLTRPVNGLITVLTIFIAAAITGPVFDWVPVTIAALSAFLIAGAANTINDFYDIEIDRVNRPERILVSGTLSPEIAFRAAIIEYCCGIALGFSISWQLGLMAGFFAGLTAIYSAFLKKTPGWGNIVVALSTGAAFVYGGIAVNRPEASMIPAIFAFLMHLGRELVKDMEDLEGDLSQGAQTLPIIWGLKKTISLIIAIFTLLMALTLWPYFFGSYGIYYLWIVLIGVYPVLLYVMGSLLLAPKARLGFLSKLIKLDMLVGLLAIYFH